MKKSKAISFLLSLSILASMIIPGTLALPASADDTPEDPKKGMEISKTATSNGNGTYTITLEAYATGEKISSEVTKDVPTDIVLVLDQSGSMAEEDFPSVGTTTYTAYTDTKNSNLYSKRHNNNGNKGNLYYPLDDGSYATVSVTRTRGASTPNYTKCGSDWKNYTTSIRDDDYWKYSENLYVMNEAGVYEKVSVAYKNTGEWWNPHYVYTYTFPNGNAVTSDGNDGQPGSNNFDGNGPVYYLSGTTPGEYTYTYSCTDAEGNTITIGTSTGENNNFTGAKLYSQTVTDGGNITRLQALKNAVTSFTDSVAQKAAGKDGIPGTGDDVDHRIAVVGFASKEDYGDNTELLSITGKNSGSVGVAYNNITEQNLKDVLQSMKTKNGRDMVNAAIAALTAEGATRTDLGMDMAERILNVNQVPAGDTRNRVVIVFTDGSPTDYNGFKRDVANVAISTAKTIKNGGTTVYSIGVFSGADANTAGEEPDKDYYDDYYGYGPNYTQAQMSAACNWFMQNLSSNNGKPQSPSYYLSAANSNTLNNIFKQIADNIESGGSATTLDEKAVIKDIISPQFQLPANATADKITLETYKYTGENQWEKNTDAMGATATVNGGQVNVTGFDFSENWCGTETTNDHTTYRGNKLVISFKVQPKAGFLGGNDVYTNTDAGIYENSSAENPLLTFDRPTVNVPIKAVNVIAADKNVYLKGEVTADQLKNGAKVSVGDVKLDLSKANDATKPYGLDPWQTQYVNIAVTVKDEDGKVISDKLENLTKDTTYTVEVTVAPKTEGKSTPEKGEAATLKTGANDPAKINVFKPELTFKDSEVYYGATAPTVFSYNSYNLVSTSWLHGTTVADTTKMGEAPTLTLTYTPDAIKISGGKINSKEDIPVAVTVNLGNVSLNDYITFKHQDCAQDSGCGWTTLTPNNGNPAFLLHVKTCQLTIEKKATEGTTIDQNQTFVFKITNNNGIDIDMEVVIKGTGKTTIKGLPVGTYTVEEDTNWSWRYTPELQNENPKTVVVDAKSPNGNISFTNKLSTNQWLSGNSYADNNVTTGMRSGVNVNAN